MKVCKLRAVALWPENPIHYPDKPDGVLSNERGSRKGIAMGTFVTAYLIVWLALFLYVVRLDFRQRRLLWILQSLRSRTACQKDREEPEARAA
jgi:CcmD family protein